MSFFNTAVVKYFFGIVGIAIVGVAASYAVSVYQYAKSPEYRAEQDLKALQKRYAEDTYGGKTPEETLELFIAALKKEDIDLAVKYFVFDKQEEWRDKLQKIKEGRQINLMVGDLSREKRKYTTFDDYVSFDVRNDKKELILTISFGQLPNKLWKMTDL
ncbi:MAG: hypothetical protein A3I44_06045 [Candidatus Sungbacteria bacterium RIFCSPLOWO2_02_FULL_51_17]|uniref:DUF4878 domain-containing protein n=1 Tax=Candidatus Sungbacteria bacterium RIFCSPHIGHO2_02_FULL_51_29 TaxID=1802273 RepID=A0A1G2KRA4_9BACT|nr:MAG: hypothetical protein A2676_03230 [Candidatus Sungbacteria bacterium RIFCSPHIGHO2_01_FULL_51_22]OHA01893.1 MAG: hypothetical protein A3C16_03305 [Candidatus Sungbacteria bacterium RIFCSPHIGHO2_02_FULL_51_29]OHA12411.1 MAG: hypothetical protein A3I44_06045 [Candidatus Sungbacteria bacterium RIFCSPLOWO2_02_FULL_51_17]